MLPLKAFSIVGILSQDSSNVMAAVLVCALLGSSTRHVSIRASSGHSDRCGVDDRDVFLFFGSGHTKRGRGREEPDRIGAYLGRSNPMIFYLHIWE